jgi:hypothetical protein
MDIIIIVILLIIIAVTILLMWPLYCLGAILALVLCVRYRWTVQWLCSHIAIVYDWMIVALWKFLRF